MITPRLPIIGCVATQFFELTPVAVRTAPAIAVFTSFRMAGYIVVAPMCSVLSNVSMWKNQGVDNVTNISVAPSDTEGRAMRSLEPLEIHPCGSFGIFALVLFQLQDDIP